MQALAHANDTIQNKDELNRVGIVWNGQQQNLQKNFSAAPSHLKSIETKLSKDENLKQP